MIDRDERVEITWIFAVIISVWLLGNAGVYYVNNANPGLAADNGAASTPASHATAPDAANRAPLEQEGRTRLIR